MWVEVIFHSTYYYLHNSTYRCNNNCQVCGKTQKCFESKHFCVWLAKHICVLQNTFVFSICGAFCCIHFRKDTNFSQKWDRLLQHQWFQENMESRQNLFFVRVQHCPPSPPNPLSSWWEQNTPSLLDRYVGIVHYSNSQFAIEREITCALTEYVVIPGHFSMMNWTGSYDSVIKKCPWIAGKWSNCTCTPLSPHWK
jgi:hypothetical protein